MTKGNKDSPGGGWTPRADDTGMATAVELAAAGVLLTGTMPALLAAYAGVVAAVGWLTRGKPGVGGARRTLCHAASAAGTLTIAIGAAQAAAWVSGEDGATAAVTEGAAVTLLAGALTDLALCTVDVDIIEIGLLALKRSKERKRDGDN